MTSFRCTCSVTQGRGDCPTPDECDVHAVPVRDRYAQCHGDCTVDCGACKGHGRPEEVCIPLGNDAHARVSPDAPPRLLAALRGLAGAVQQDFGTATPAHNPGLDHLLEEVAVEVLRQDAAGERLQNDHWHRDDLIAMAAQCIRDARAADQAAGGEQP